MNIYQAQIPLLLTISIIKVELEPNDNDFHINSINALPVHKIGDK
ncbi:MAG TPA: hypothetical protein VIK55_03640 [Paludibacter sp.]